MVLSLSALLSLKLRLGHRIRLLLPARARAACRHHAQHDALLGYGLHHGV